jgi:multiple sugar transport system substrate-binding protein
MVKFAEETPYTRSIDAVADLKEILDAISQEYERCAVYGQITPTEAVKDAIDRMRLITEWNK